MPFEQLGLQLGLAPAPTNSSCFLRTSARHSDMALLLPSELRPVRTHSPFHGQTSLVGFTVSQGPQLCHRPDMCSQRHRLSGPEATRVSGRVPAARVGSSANRRVIGWYSATRLSGQRVTLC